MKNYDDDLQGDDGPSVDLFGLNEFGENVGARELWGAVLGTTMSTGVAIGARALGGPGIAKYSELIGLTTGALAGGVMIAMKSTRAAGWTAVAVSVVGSGLRFIEQMLVSPAAGAVDGTVIERLDRYGNNTPMGATVLEPLAGAQLGATVLEPLAGAQVGATQPPVNRQINTGLPAHAGFVKAAGGPALSGLASAYGGTIFGS